MRTRSKYETPVYKDVPQSDTTTYNWSSADHMWVNPTSGHASSMAPYMSATGYSRIEDYPGLQQLTKPVTHVQYKHVKMFPTNRDEYTTTAWGGGDPITRYIENAEGHYRSWGGYGAIGPEDISVSWNANVQDMQRQAMSRFNDTNQVDNLLNVIESEQFVSSLTSLGDLFRRMKASGKALRTIGLKEAYRTLQATGSYEAYKGLSSRVRKGNKMRLLDVSNLYLAWQFGFAPLISDMQKCIRSVHNLRADLNKAVAQQGKRSSVTMRCTGTMKIVPARGLEGFAAEWDPSSTPDGTWWHAKISHLSAPLCVVGVSGMRNSSYNLSGFKKLDYLMNRFVSPGPVSAMWEHIPYSFVVDWFADLSGIINELNDVIGRPKLIDNAWVSYKYEALIQAMKHRYKNWVSDSDGLLTASNEVHYYHREPLSLSPQIGMSGRFGKKQVALSAALLHQLVARLKAR